MMTAVLSYIMEQVALPLGRNVLVEGAAGGHRQDLIAATDAENRQVFTERPNGTGDFEFVADFVYVPQLRMRLMTVTRGVDIVPSRQEQPVNHAVQTVDRLGVHPQGNAERGPARAQYCFDILLINRRSQERLPDGAHSYSDEWLDHVLPFHQLFAPFFARSGPENVWYHGTPRPGSSLAPPTKVIMIPFTLDRQFLSIADVVDVARGGRPVALGERAVLGMRRSRAIVDQVVTTRATVYGVTTGFGKFADRAIPVASLEELQHNLIRSHSVGVGVPLQEDVVRAMLFLRVASLSQGYSGIRVETVQALVDMLNAGIVPIVPSKGSVGASGDLAPLAHLALVLTGEGEALHRGRRMAGGAALKLCDLEPVHLTAKEGLALINGTQLMNALGVLLEHDAENVLRVADIAGSMSLEAVRGTNRAFDPRVQQIRPHAGQVAVGEHLCQLTADSEIMASHRRDAHRVQDPYSLRCMPQVHGASRDAVAYLAGVMETEVNSVTDNPLIFAEDGQIISCGNFHGQPLAMALDFAGIALAELADISERRIEAMLDPHFSELPPFLTMHGGVDSGFMVSQYTAAALVSENKILAHPASVDSIPTSANQEDHVSMGVTAGHKARTIMDNVELVLAIELLCGAEGIDYRRPLKTSPRLEAVHAVIRAEVPHMDGDRVLYPDIEGVARMVRDGRIRAAGDELEIA